ncbi:MAG TPA: CAP domain-containing protein, partial [Candidatus Limnocylindrales bacterium]
MSGVSGPSGTGTLLVAWTALAATVAMAAVLAWAPAATRAAAYDRFYAGFAGEELMRAINADRTALHLPPYAADATLEAIARDRPTTCPTNAGLTIRGRARDMADRGYFSHVVAGCTATDGTSFDAFDLLVREGYASVSKGEDISTNNYPSSVTSYALGCSIDGTGCVGATSLPWTVAVAEQGFMSSSGHRANLLSAGFDRFGCGAWRSAGGSNLYACYFSNGGNGSIDASGPTISGLSGAGATFRTGSSATFSAGFGGGASLLADGYVALDGVHLRNWAWDDVVSGSVAVTTPALTAGGHTVTWWARDASSNVRSASFTISVGGSGGTTASATPRPPMTPPAAPPPTRSPVPTPTADAAGGSSAPSDPSSLTPGATAAGNGPTVEPSGGLPSGAPALSAISPEPATGGLSGSGGRVRPVPDVVAAGGPTTDPTAGVLAWLGLAGGLYVAGALILGFAASGRGPG